jgi:hypothetical protein
MEAARDGTTITSTSPPSSPPRPAYSSDCKRRRGLTSTAAAPGFLRVLDRRTIAFADLRGSRQFITQNNLAENPGPLFRLTATGSGSSVGANERGRDDAALLAGQS